MFNMIPTYASQFPITKPIHYRPPDTPRRSRTGVLGVFQLVNKFDGLAFTRNDENFVEAFAIFCGMGINNVRMYEAAVMAHAKQQVGKDCDGTAL